MKGKVLLVVGLGVGYVLGARAGRERYDQIAAAAGKVWHSPRVQTQVDRTLDFVNAKVDAVLDIAATGAKNVVNRITGGPRPAAPVRTPAVAAKAPAAKTATKAAAPKEA